MGQKESIRDIYSRDDEAPNYQATVLEVDDTLSDLIIKIESTLFTNKFEVLGSPNFGCNLDDLIFSLVTNEDTIQESISSQIHTFALNTRTSYSVQVEVKFFARDTSNGCYIDIVIDGARALGVVY